MRNEHSSIAIVRAIARWAAISGWRQPAEGCQEVQGY
jgi:hypothetical protein